jgi:hypothetical protein
VYKPFNEAFEEFRFPVTTSIDSFRKAFEEQYVSAVNKKEGDSNSESFKNDNLFVALLHSAAALYFSGHPDLLNA